MDSSPSITADTIRQYETPEGVLLQLKLAGPVVRACAWTIDLAIKAVLYIIISIITSLFGGVGMAVMLIGFFLLEWFYPVFFEVSSGATPGKKAMGLVVVHDNGTPISWSASLIRNLLRVADFFPLFYGTGLLVMLASNRFQRLGDMVAGTLVVYREREKTDIEIPTVTPKPPPIHLSVDELRNLLFIHHAVNEEVVIEAQPAYNKRWNQKQGKGNKEVGNIFTQGAGKVGNDEYQQAPQPRAMACIKLLVSAQDQAVQLFDQGGTVASALCQCIVVTDLPVEVWQSGDTDILVLLLARGQLQSVEDSLQLLPQRLVSLYKCLLVH